jgi:hypothetical protein
MWEPRRLTSLWVSRAWCMDSFAFTFTFAVYHVTNLHIFQPTQKKWKTVFCLLGHNKALNPLTVIRGLREMRHLHLQGWRTKQDTSLNQSANRALYASFWYLALITHPWRWRRHFHPKRQLNFEGLRGIMGLFVITTVRTSNITKYKMLIASWKFLCECRRV